MERIRYLLMSLAFSIAVLLMAEKHVLIDQFAIASTIGVILSGVFSLFKNNILNKMEEERKKKDRKNLLLSTQ